MRVAAAGTGPRGTVHNRPMLWIKAFHIVFVAAWFAGLFYLPRIFVNLAMVPADSHAERERLLLMARKLYRFITPLGVLAIGLGLSGCYVMPLNQYPASATSSSARERLTTRIQGTISSAPEADLASTPPSGGRARRDGAR